MGLKTVFTRPLSDVTEAAGMWAERCTSHKDFL